MRLETELVISPLTFCKMCDTIEVGGSIYPLNKSKDVKLQGGTHMVVMCEISATAGIICSMVQGEGITEYSKDQRRVNIHGWEVEFSRVCGSRVAKLTCSYNEGKQELAGRHRMFFVLENGTLYLKVKPKSIDANFVAGDLASVFIKKYNIHEVRKADPNRMVDLVAWRPDGTPYQYVTALTDGEIVPRKSRANVRSVDTCKVQHATWVIVAYENPEAKTEYDRRFNVLYSMMHNYRLIEKLDTHYDKYNLSQLR